MVASLQTSRTRIMDIQRKRGSKSRKKGMKLGHRHIIKVVRKAKTSKCTLAFYDNFKA